MPTRFTLYYWPIPFRAQPIRYILAHAGEAWDEPDRDALTAFNSRRSPTNLCPSWVRRCSTNAENAPKILVLSHRIAGSPAIEALRADQRDRWGNVWCDRTGGHHGYADSQAGHLQ